MADEHNGETADVPGAFKDVAGAASRVLSESELHEEVIPRYFRVAQAAIWAAACTAQKIKNGTLDDTSLAEIFTEDDRVQLILQAHNMAFACAMREAVGNHPLGD